MPKPHNSFKALPLAHHSHFPTLFSDFYLLRIWPSFIQLPQTSVSLCCSPTHHRRLLFQSLCNGWSPYFKCSSSKYSCGSLPAWSFTSFKSLLKCHFLMKPSPTILFKITYTPPTLASSPYLAYLSSIILYNLRTHCGY